MDFHNKVRKVLTELGLTEVQADFYLYLLKNNGATVSKVAKSLNINRTNSYAILEKLLRLELVTEENRVNGKVLRARSYEAINNILKQREEEIDSSKRTVQELVPIFKTFASYENQYGPRIRTYESKVGLNDIVDDILATAEETKEIQLFTNQESERGFFSNAKHEEFIKRRVEKGIRIRVLAVDNEFGRELKNDDEKLLRETRILPEKFSFNAEIYIYGNTISMLDVKNEIIGVVIESEELTSIQRQFFEVAWAMSE